MYSSFRILTHTSMETTQPIRMQFLYKTFFYFSLTVFIQSSVFQSYFPPPPPPPLTLPLMRLCQSDIHNRFYFFGWSAFHPGILYLLVDLKNAQTSAIFVLESSMHIDKYTAPCIHHYSAMQISSPANPNSPELPLVRHYLLNPWSHWSFVASFLFCLFWNII